MGTVHFLNKFRNFSGGDSLGIQLNNRRFQAITVPTVGWQGVIFKDAVAIPRNG